jgi:hypothetical protein
MLKHIRDRVQLKQWDIGLVSDSARSDAWLRTCALVKIAESGNPDEDLTAHFDRAIADIKNWLGTLNA